MLGSILQKSTEKSLADLRGSVNTKVAKDKKKKFLYSYSVQEFTTVHLRKQGELQQLICCCKSIISGFQKKVIHY